MSFAPEATSEKPAGANLSDRVLRQGSCKRDVFLSPFDQSAKRDESLCYHFGDQLFVRFGQCFAKGEVRLAANGG